MRSFATIRLLTSELEGKMEVQQNVERLYVDRRMLVYLQVYVCKMFFAQNDARG